MFELGMFYIIHKDYMHVFNVSEAMQKVVWCRLCAIIMHVKSNTDI